MQPNTASLRLEYSEILQEVERMIRNNVRPADEIVLNDYKLQKMLDVSKRTTASWRANRQITYSKLNGIIIYKLSDVLEFIDSNKVEKI